MYERLISYVDLQPNDRVLDVGAGRGHIWSTVQRYIGSEGRVILLDICQTDLLAALSVEGVDSRLQAVCGEAVNLPLKAASINVVTTHSVLIYVLDKRRAIHEFFRVLSPTGWAYLCEPIPSLLEEKASFDWGRWYKFRQAIEELRTASWQDPLFKAGMECNEELLVRFLHESGFQIVHIERETVPKLEQGSPENILRMWKPPQLTAKGYQPWHRLLAERFSLPEMEAFAALVSEMVASGRFLVTLPLVYIWARKLCS